MTVKELRTRLEVLGVKLSPRVRKDELIAIFVRRGEEE